MADRWSEFEVQPSEPAPDTEVSSPGGPGGVDRWSQYDVSPDEAVHDPQEESGTGWWSSYGTLLPQALTFGFGDEISAGLERAIGAITGEAAYEGADYRQLRDVYRKEASEAAAAHPSAFWAAELTGGLPMAFVPGLNLSKAAQAGKLGRAAALAARGGRSLKGAAKIGALEGMTYGAVRGAGEAESLEPGEIAGKVVTGAGLGAAGGAVLGPAFNRVFGKKGRGLPEDLSADVVPEVATPEPSVAQGAMQDGSPLPRTIQGDEVVPEPILASRAADPDAVSPLPMTEEKFGQLVRENVDLPEEQLEADLAIFRARAKTWAQQNGRAPDEWYAMHIADVQRGGNAKRAALFQQIHEAYKDSMADYHEAAQGYQTTDFDEYFSGVSRFWNRLSRQPSALRQNQKTLFSLDLTTNCPQAAAGHPCAYCYVELPRGYSEVLATRGKRLPMSPSKRVARLEYSDEILNLPDEMVSYLNDEMGGLRMYSLGDFEEWQIPVVNKILGHAQKRGLKIKAITKDPKFVELYAKHPAVRINISTDGLPSNVTRAMPLEEAARLKKGNPHVKIRYMAMNFEDAVKAGLDPRIDVLTLYHGYVGDTLATAIKASNPALVRELGEEGIDALASQFENVKLSPKKFNEIVKKFGRKVCCSSGKCGTCTTCCGFGKGGIRKGLKVLKQDLDAITRGSTEFLDDGRALIRAYQAADVSTLAHEAAHIFRRELKSDLLAAAEKWAGVKPGGEWATAHEEMFARGFERYLRSGKAPTTELSAVFENFKRWLVEIYRSLRGGPLDVKLNKNIRAVFDDLLGGPQVGETRTLYQRFDDFDELVQKRIPMPDGMEVTPTELDRRIQRLGKFKASRKGDIEPMEAKIAYYRKNRARLEDPERIHLNPNEKNTLKTIVEDDFLATHKRMKSYEAETDKILQDVSIDEKKVAVPVLREIARLKGRRYHAENLGTIETLQEVLAGREFTNLAGEAERVPGVLSGTGRIDGVETRNLVRDLRSGNIQAYRSAGPVPISRRSLKRVAEAINKVLHEQVRAKRGAAVAKDFSRLMDEYAQDTAAYALLKEKWGAARASDSGSWSDTWYDTNAVHKIQKVVDGDRSPTGIARALIHIGKQNGNDYLQIVRDNFVIADLFPERATGLDRGTWTRTTGRAAGAMLALGQGGYFSALRQGAGAALGVQETMRQYLAKRMLKQEYVPEILLPKRPPRPSAASVVARTGVARATSEREKAVRHYVLMQRDPNYRARWEKEQSRKEQ